MGAAAIPAGITLAGGAFSAFAQGEAGKSTASYYDYLAKTAGINSGLADAQDIAEKKQIGQKEAQEQVLLTNRVNETVGAEKTAMVSGVGASSRSAQTIIGDTLDKGNLDEMALRLNADTESRNADVKSEMAKMNYGTQIAGYNMAGANAVRTAKAGQISTLLGSVGNVANSYYQGDMYARRGPGTIGSVQ